MGSCFTLSWPLVIFLSCVLWSSLTTSAHLSVCGSYCLKVTVLTQTQCWCDGSTPWRLRTPCINHQHCHKASTQPCTDSFQLVCLSGLFTFTAATLLLEFWTSSRCSKPGWVFDMWFSQSRAHGWCVIFISACEDFPSSARAKDHTVDYEAYVHISDYITTLLWCWRDLKRYSFIHFAECVW